MRVTKSARLNVRLSPATVAQLDELATVFGNRTAAITIAVDRMYNQERSIMSDDGISEAILQRRGIVSDSITQIERAVLVVLRDAGEVHPVLETWRSRLLEDPAYCEPWPGDELAAHLHISDTDAWTTYPRLPGSRVERGPVLRDFAVYWLGRALAQYRRRGRPAGTWAVPLGPAGPCAVYVCLESALAEFVVHIRSADLDLFYGAERTHLYTQEG